MLTKALKRIRSSVDPCGESIQVRALLESLERCSRRHYRVCISTSVARNVFDRPIDGGGAGDLRTVTWNPELRTELERSCDGDPARPVQRDPTASLLHELAHAAQDCAGLNPGEHELEAVRIENIYRRAAGLCQRTGYGTIPLPPDKIKLCTAARCSCSIPAANGRVLNVAETHGAKDRWHGDRPE